MRKQEHMLHSTSHIPASNQHCSRIYPVIHTQAMEEAISEPVLSLLPSLTTAFRRRTVETSNKGCDDSHLGSAMNAIGTE